MLWNYFISAEYYETCFVFLFFDLTLQINLAKYLAEFFVNFSQRERQLFDHLCQVRFHSSFWLVNREWIHLIFNVVTATEYMWYVLLSSTAESDTESKECYSKGPNYLRDLLYALSLGCEPANPLLNCSKRKRY